MAWVSAPNIEDALLEQARPRFSTAWIGRAYRRLEAFLEAERGQLPAWFVAAVGAGIAAWLWLPDRAAWLSFILFALALAGVGLTWGQGRTARALLVGGLALGTGCGWIWARSEWVASPRLARPAITIVVARVERIEPLVAKGDFRLTLAPSTPGLPPIIRVSLPAEDLPATLSAGARITVRARLQPPPPMVLPGSHDFARDAWFDRRGAVGRAIGPVTVVQASGSSGGLDALRNRLGAHIKAQLPGSSGGIATALANGDQTGVGDEDADAMRRSGLAHLLSVSGLHIAAAVGAAMILSLRLLALSERLALRVNLVLVSAAFGAAAGIGYTFLTGLQVPTVRSCIAAVLVLGGMALGREAISLRLVAVGALLVMLFRPEAIAGASFQLSFAAVTSIIVFHQLPVIQRLLGPREEGHAMRLARAFLGLMLTGLVVEVALMPFALYHFHRAGLYGVAANLFAIPLTTFVVMPLEAGALLLDTFGLGAPLWAATGWSIDLMLTVAHRVADTKGAVAMLPTMPRWAFAAMVAAGLWACLWRGKARWLGVVPLLIGVAGAAAAPVPDLLVTGDGEHVAVVGPDGTPMLLRAKAGDFVRDVMSEAAAFDGDPLALEEQSFARCNRDACIADIVRDGQAWRLLAIRSRDRIDWTSLTRACADADIVVASRFLPRGCTPRWLKLDRPTLAASGGVAIRLGPTPTITSAAERLGKHPWAIPATSPPTARIPRAPPGSRQADTTPRIARSVTMGEGALPIVSRGPDAPNYRASRASATERTVVSDIEAMRPPNDH